MQDARGTGGGQGRGGQRNGGMGGQGNWDGSELKEVTLAGESWKYLKRGFCCLSSDKMESRITTCEG